MKYTQKIMKMVGVCLGEKSYTFETDWDILFKTGYNSYKGRFHSFSNV